MRLNLENSNDCHVCLNQRRQHVLLQRGAAVPLRAPLLRRERRRVVRHHRGQRERQGELGRRNEERKVPPAEGHPDVGQGKDGRQTGRN